MYIQPSSVGLTALATLLIAHTSAQSCESYGIDFQNGGSYFINTNSNASFTVVSEFSGCANDTASVMLVDPNEVGYECSDIPLKPDYTPEMSTCDITKNQMFSGEWIIIIASNNGDDDPLAVQRNIDLTCGPQQTATVTPTLTFNKTVVPTVSATNTSTVSIASTVNASTTVVIPASTHVTTITPDPVTTTSWHSVLHTHHAWTATSDIVYETITPACNVPPRQPWSDPICTFWPKNLSPPQFNIPGIPKKRDTAMNAADVRALYKRAKARRTAQKMAEAAAAVRDTLPRDVSVPKHTFARRSADQPTLTTTLLSPIISSTSTITGPATTLYNVTITTEIDYTTLPAPTVYSGVQDVTSTAPTPTQTCVEVTYSKTTVTSTYTATHTHYTSVVPQPSAESCKRAGGHWQWPFMPSDWN